MTGYRSGGTSISFVANHRPKACAPFGAPAAAATSPYAAQRPLGIDAMNSRARSKSSELPPRAPDMRQGYDPSTLDERRRHRSATAASRSSREATAGSERSPHRSEEAPYFIAWRP